MRYLNWINVILGAVLFIAPFLFHYTGSTGALWTSLILGVLIAGLGYLRSFRWAAAMGIIAFIAPFIAGFSGSMPALWTSMIVGVLVAILDGYQAWFAEEAPSSTAQHGHV